jgi:hypothetical protein
LFKTQNDKIKQTQKEVKEMFKMPEKIDYALPENIGEPKLFTGRKKEFDYFLGSWYESLEKNYAMCTAILSRRKKGKTAFLQRLFNILWSSETEVENGEINIIPFYYSIRDTEQTLGKFAKQFFVQFICQYLSYKKRNKDYINTNYEFEELAELIDDKEIKKLYKSMTITIKNDDWQSMWDIASESPAIIARRNGEKIVQIIDEFQNINEYITDKRGKILKGMSGTYMRVAEMREAPLIVSGSEVHWLLRIVTSLTGRFRSYNLENLPKEEALEAIEKYAAFRETKINEEAKEKIWQLTRGDPLYIKALFFSRYNEKKDYTAEENIIDVYEKEIQEGGEIYGTWMEYMYKTFNTVNKVNSKRIMLYLFQEGKERTRAELKKALNLKYTDEELETKLEALIKGDLISQGSTAYRYTITKDKTYELFFRKKYQDEIEHFIPDIKKELRKIMGKENYTKGKFTEFLLKENLKKPFNLKDICENGEELRINPKEIEERKIIKTGVGKNEIDLYIKAQKGYTIYVDVKNTKARYGKRQLERWLRIAAFIRSNTEKAIFIVYSENGYTKVAKEKLVENKIYLVK